MALQPLAKRVSLVEYGPPIPIIREASTALTLEEQLIRDLLRTSGERVARTLNLSSNPIAVAGDTIRVTDVAGIVRVGPQLELEVAPKFLGVSWDHWREDLFFMTMLSRHGRLLTSERIAASRGDRGDLATLVGRAMVTMFWDTHRRPLRTYRRDQVREFAIDGEMDPETVFIPEAEGYSQQVVTYDRKNRFNGAILFAAQSLMPEVRDPRTRAELSRVCQALVPQVQRRMFGHARVPSRAGKWQPLHDLAVDVLNGFGLTLDLAQMRAPGFVIDTWRVWEDVMAVALRLGWGSSNVLSQRPIALGTRRTFDVVGAVLPKVAWVTPDFAVAGTHELILDAKYKGRVGEDRTRIAEQDLYEALAYATAANCKQVVLLYPSVVGADPPLPVGTIRLFEQVAVGLVVVSGVEVEVRGISGGGALRQFADNIASGIRRFAVESTAATAT